MPGWTGGPRAVEYEAIVIEQLAAGRLTRIGGQEQAPDGRGMVCAGDRQIRGKMTCCPAGYTTADRFSVAVAASTAKVITTDQTAQCRQDQNQACRGYAAWLCPPRFRRSGSSRPPAVLYRD